MGPAGDRFNGAIAIDVFAGRTITLAVARHRIVVETPASLERIRRTAHEVPIRLVRAADGPALKAAGSAVVKDLIMNGDIGRDVLKHWSVTLDLANGRGWIDTDRQ